MQVLVEKPSEMDELSSAGPKPQRNMTTWIYFICCAWPGEHLSKHAVLCQVRTFQVRTITYYYCWKTFASRLRLNNRSNIAFHVRSDEALLLSTVVILLSSDLGKCGSSSILTLLPTGLGHLCSQYSTGCLGAKTWCHRPLESPYMFDKS